MREQVEQRVGELKAELHKGQQMLAELEAKEADLRQTLLRISGAIQVLEELLAGATPPPGGTPTAGGTPAAVPVSVSVPGPGNGLAGAHA